MNVDRQSRQANLPNKDIFNLDFYKCIISRFDLFTILTRKFLFSQRKDNIDLGYLCYIICFSIFTHYIFFENMMCIAIIFSRLSLNRMNFYFFILSVQKFILELFWCQFYKFRSSTRSIYENCYIIYRNIYFSFFQLLMFQNNKDCSSRMINLLIHNSVSKLYLRW